MTKPTARRFASHIEMLAHGGYICGDHSYEDMLTMEREAADIRAAAR